jgi:5-formyltetrahydrofolate cyclo-ligase
VDWFVFLDSVKNSSSEKADLRAMYSVVAESAWRDLAKAKAVVEKLKFILPESKRIAGFKPLKGEPDLAALYSDSGYTFVFPRVEGEELRFYKPTSLNAFTESSWGILEPIPEKCEAVETSAIDVFLVPGVAFDRKLFRLGRGRGFYDRTLAKSPKALKIGVAAAAQVSLTEIAHEEHDCPMDMIVTEKYFLQRLKAS